jgi:hypothetical protein
MNIDAMQVLQRVQVRLGNEISNSAVLEIRIEQLENQVSDLMSKLRDAGLTIEEEDNG